MRIGFLGDSITEGKGASCEENCFVSQVGKILNAEVINYGICGTRLAKRTSQYKDQRREIYFNMRLELMEDDLDMVFVFGGTNDYGHGNAPIGNLDDNTVWTFSGAVNVLIDNLIKKYTKEKIRFIIPIKRFNYLNKARFTDGNLLDFVTALKKVLEKRDIFYLDLWDLFEEPTTDTESKYFVDGLHPNDLGHRIIAEKISNYIKSLKK